MTQTNDPPLISSLELIPDYQAVIAQEAGGIESVQTFGDLPTVDPPQLAFVIDEGNYYVSQPNPDVFDISKATVETTIGASEGKSRGFEISNDGTKYFEIGANGDNIYQNNLSTPFELSSASSGFSINAQDNFVSGLGASPDGSKFYENGSENNKLHQYDLSTPFDLSTATLVTSINVPVGGRGTVVSNDGTVLYIAAGTNYDKFNLSTPFEISSATFETSISSVQGVNVRSMEFDDTGRTFLTGADKIYQSELGTAFDLNTIQSTISINANGGSSVEGLAWSPNGSRLYELQNGGPITQFNLPINPDWKEIS